MRPFLITLAFLLHANLHAEEPTTGQRVLFLGDSITQAGQYVAIIDAAMILAHPDQKVEIIGCGLSSETVSGLSEPGHADGAFPRPDLHERLDRVLDKVKPNTVMACYGMNDGIYMPLSDDRFKAYRDGMTKLHDKVIAIGASMIHLTPPVYDPVAIPSRVDLTGEPGHNYAKYNEVLDAYSDWLLSQREHGWTVIDLHGPMKAALAEGRSKDPKFVLAKDGVHPGDEGHRLMAMAVLKAWGVSDPASHPKAAEVQKLTLQKRAILSDAYLTAAGHKRPGVKPGLPLEEALPKAAALDEQARALARQK